MTKKQKNTWEVCVCIHTGAICMQNHEQLQFADDSVISLSGCCQVSGEGDVTAKNKS